MTAAINSKTNKKPFAQKLIFLINNKSEDDPITGSRLKVRLTVKAIIFSTHWQKLKSNNRTKPGKHQQPHPSLPVRNNIIRWKLLQIKWHKNRQCNKPPAQLLGKHRFRIDPFQQTA